MVFAQPGIWFSSVSSVDFNHFGVYGGLCVPDWARFQSRFRYSEPPKSIKAP